MPLRLIATALFITDFIVLKTPSDVVCSSLDGAHETRLSMVTPARSCEAPGTKGAPHWIFQRGFWRQDNINRVICQVIISLCELFYCNKNSGDLYRRSGYSLFTHSRMFCSVYRSMWFRPFIAASGFRLSGLSCPSLAPPAPANGRRPSPFRRRDANSMFLLPRKISEPPQSGARASYVIIISV